jgi:hypothetical protein
MVKSGRTQNLLDVLKDGDGDAPLPYPIDSEAIGFQFILALALFLETYNFMGVPLSAAEARALRERHHNFRHFSSFYAF